MKSNKQSSPTLFTPYQYTRGVRFQVKPDPKTINSLNKKITQQAKAKISLADLEKDLLGFYKNLKELLFYERRNEKKNKNKDLDKNNQNFKTKISVNKLWFKRWHKDIFYTQIKNNSNKQGKYDLNSLNSLPFKEKLEQWKKACEQIKDASLAVQEAQYRSSDIAENIKVLLKHLGYFDDLLKELYATQMEDDKKIETLKINSKNIQKKLKEAEQNYLSSQSSGIEIARASLNYYTVNKKPKEYEVELSKAKINLGEDYFLSQENSSQKKFFSKIIEKSSNYILQKDKDNKAIFQFKSKQEKEWIERFCEKKFKKNLKKNDIGLSLNQTYFLMKAFKAEQKSLFYELASRVPVEINNNLKNKNATLLFNRYQMKSSHTNPYQKEDYINNNKNHILYKYSFKNQNFSSIENLSCSFSLFKGNLQNKKNFYKKFIELSKNIKTSKNSDKSEWAKKRGKYLQDSNKYKTKTHPSQNSEGKAYFKDYTKFCDEYKKIAQQRGKLIAQVKGIEKEERESSQTNYWALIWTKPDNKKQLWLVPKKASQDINTESENTNLQSAKKCIDKKDSIRIKTDFYLSCFKSLTMRALHKLCFAEESSFVKDMPDYLKKQQKEVKEFKTNKGEKEKLKEKEKKEIQFLKELLKSPYAHKKLQLDNFDLKEVYEAKDKKEFERALEKACYYEKKITFNDKEKQYFLKQFNVSVLNISSYDLEGRNKNTYQSPASENRIHTDWWNKFWKQSKSNQDNSIGAIRLNPEVKIRYREEDKNLKKYLKNRGFSIEDNNFKHRKIQDQITTHFTLSLNAGKKYEDLAFSKPEEILQKIEDFNKKLNKDRSFDTTWKYGIDRGNIELATLCLAKFKPEETYKVNEEEILKPTFPKPEKDIPCYSLKDYNLTENYQTKTEGEKTRFAVKNISYFLEKKYLNNTDLFKKENLTCLDLTTAKVIKGKIITNGDIMTYLKLKKAVAKRRLFELYAKGDIYSSSNLEWSIYENGKENSKRSEGVLNIKTNEGEKTIYWYCKKYKDILIDSKNNMKYNQESIKNSLRFYLDSLKRSNNSEHTPSILKINHLRDAITANMVGVICFLQKKYSGFIILEDLDKKIIDKHFFQHEENISRRLENALYNKFQSLGLVPPHVKDIIQLRESYRENRDKNKSGLEDKKLSQIGAICFVPEKNTSKNCPYCEKPADKNDDLKFRQHRFLCDENSCSFDTYYFNKNYTEDPKPKIDESKKKTEFEIIKDIDDPDKVAAFNIAKKKPL